MKKHKQASYTRTGVTLSKSTKGFDYEGVLQRGEMDHEVTLVPK